MLYNIHYEVSAAVFMFCLVLYVRLQYSLKEDRNKSFYRLMVCTLFCNIMDVFTAITISYADIVPKTFNVIINTIFFISTGTLGYIFLRYSIFCCVEDIKNNIVNKIAKIIYVIYCFFLISNIYTGVIFSFSTGEYVHGKLYYSVYVFMYTFFLIASIYMIRYSLRLSWEKRISIYMFLLFSASGFILQLLFYPNVLINIFGVSVASVIILFSLENQEYQQLIKALEELQEMNEKVNEAVDTKNRFLENISVSIRKPVKEMMHLSEKISMDNNMEQAKENAQKILYEGEEVLGRLDQILDYTDLMLEKTVICKEEYNVKYLLETCSNLVVDRIKKKGIHFEIKVEKGMPKILLGDRYHVSLIIREMLENALKYTQEGSIILKAQIKDLPKKKAVLVISVEDTGIGISKEKQKEIFDYFEGKDNKILDNKESRSNLGLSLPYAKKLAKLLGGDMGVYSSPGKGSLFYFESLQEIVQL